MLQNQSYEAMIGEQKIVVETGKLAQQAGGAVTVRCGDTLLFTAATMSRSQREGIDFFPLTVDYEARLYAAGRIPGSFFRLRSFRDSKAASRLMKSDWRNSARPRSSRTTWTNTSPIFWSRATPNWGRGSKRRPSSTCSRRLTRWYNKTTCVTRAVARTIVCGRSCGVRF